jgi:hypothetical protein
MSFDSEASLIRVNCDLHALISSIQLHRLAVLSMALSIASGKRFWTGASAEARVSTHDGRRTRWLALVFLR